MLDYYPVKTSELKVLENVFYCETSKTRLEAADPSAALLNTSARRSRWRRLQRSGINAW